MRKLIASLVLVVLTTIASLGWSISEFAALQNPDTETPSVANRLIALNLMGGALALSLLGEFGGLLLARAVADGALSDDILRACRQFGADLADDGEK